jgi:hypothetical protein
MRARGSLGAVLLSCLACACGDDTSRVELLPYLGYCVGLGGVSPCPRTVDGDLFDPIEGFEFEWGYQTELRILTRHIEHPPADGSSLEYYLVDVLSRTAVKPGTRFELGFYAMLLPEDLSRLVAGDCAGGYELFPDSSQEKQFSLEDSSVCESFEQFIPRQVSRTLSFEFDTPEAPLTLVAFE